MADGAGSLIVQVWDWAKTNDLPNWAVVLFTGIVWPLVLWRWNRRTVGNIPHLTVRLRAIGVTIGDVPLPAVGVDFINHTGSVVYLSGARIVGCTAQMQVPPLAARDIAENSQTLRFWNDATSLYDRREITLQTGETAQSFVAVAEPLPISFYMYKPSFLRRYSLFRKYFVLKYTAMVGTTRRSVATVY